MTTTSLRVGIVVGENSGDILGAGLMEAIRGAYPDACFEGIGGPMMQQQAFNSLYPMESLAVMGIEVLSHLPELIGIRRGLIDHFRAHPPDVFVGIDAPDFTLGLERKLKASGIKTVHYVSPQFWAWRQGRVKKMARTLDLMLVLFPFEIDFYRQFQVPVKFVGHHLADLIADENPPQKSREALGIAAHEKVIALLPGSRMSEVKKLTEPFIRAAALCREHMPQCKVLIAAANQKVADAITQELSATRLLPDARVLVAQARQVMTAADALLLASGTVTLEAMLIKRPMVVAYKVSRLTYSIAKRLVKSEYIALPNLLAGRRLVPEFVQDEASPEALAQALLGYFEDPQLAQRQKQCFLNIHQELRQNASVAAGQAVIDLVRQTAD